MSSEPEESTSDSQPEESSSDSYKIVISDFSLKVSEGEEEFTESKVYHQHLSDYYEVVRGPSYVATVTLINKSGGQFPGGSTETHISEYTPGFQSVDRTITDSPDISRLAHNEETEIEINVGHFYSDSGFSIRFRIEPDDDNSATLFDGSLEGAEYDDGFLRPFSVIDRIELDILNQLVEINNKLGGC